MGTNKRYAAAVDRRMDQKILERIARDAGPLQSLSREEIGLDTEPVTIDPKPKPVRAWVRFGATPVWVDGQACRWTSDAVAIRFLVGEAEHRTWVWASAVTPISAKPPAG
ncbi:hypothetical protein ACI2K6_10405 [Microbacterium sp. NPDC006705]|uniref:hypothetical protein n=1 Tax=Microbacterium sp. NPDC006705 TaxID=3364181 RepID=UPI0038502F92